MLPQKVMFLDFETYYSDDYTLRKMTPVEYILDPRFACIGCAVKQAHLDAMWLRGEQLPEFFRSLDNDWTVVTHNALFDMCITAWCYGYVPHRMVDTLGVSRACLGHVLKSLSLESVAKHLGLGVKGGTVHQVKNMTAAQIRTSGLYDQYVDYSLNDVTLCAGIYDKLVSSGVFPESELDVMDMVLRCAVKPQFKLDQMVLAEHLATIKSQKQALLDRCGADKEQLMSNDKFAELLRGFGVTPPMKTSPLTGKQTYAFAKSDMAFIELSEHENPDVQTLVSARLGHKSTIEETRAQKFLTISQLQWPVESVTSQGNLPVPLRFSGAHTHRLSGDWALNMQNLPRVGALKRALTAPEGYAVVDVDASQIEARIVAWICGQTDLVEQFRRGEDVYCNFASEVFKRPVTKADKVERFIGKTGILGLGYGVGWRKFQNTVKVKSRLDLGQEVVLDDNEATEIVNGYRLNYLRIPEAWGQLNQAIDVLGSGEWSFTIGPCSFHNGYISLPSGLRLSYPKLNYTVDGWVYEHAQLRKAKKLYGGALLENIVQALARIVVMGAGTRIQNRLAPHNLQLALQVHDSLVYVVPTKAADHVKEIVLCEMCKPPSWAPDLPLAAEAKIGPNYADTT